MKKHYYFAYGANTNLQSMANRCPDAQSLGAATLPDHHFRFNYHADVVPQCGTQTVGVLWRITDRCLHSLDRFEGYPEYYIRKTVDVKHGETWVSAIVYVMTDQPRWAPPSTDYLDTLMEGYRDHDLDILQLTSAVHDSYERIGEVG